MHSRDRRGYEELRSLEQELSFGYAKSIFSQREVTFEEAQMHTLGLTEPNGLYTNLALLLSDQCPHLIKAARLHGNPGDFSFQDRAEFSGSVFKQLEGVFDFVDRHNSLQSTFGGLYRNDSRDYPTEAVREVLINAVIHRDYASSAPLLVKVYDTEIEVVSYGGLVPGLELDDIFTGISSPRNRRLAEVFHRLGIIEAYGTGIQRVFGAYRVDDLSPSFVCTPHVFKVSLPNRNAPEVAPACSAAIARNQKRGQGPDGYLQSRTDAGAPSALNRQRHDASRRRIEDYHLTFDPADIAKTLEYTQVHGAITRSQVEKLLGVRQTTAGKILRQLVDAGSLVQEGRGPQTRYRLAG